MTRIALLERLGALAPAGLLVAPLVLLGSPMAALAQDDVGSAAWLRGCWVASAGDVRSEEVRNLSTTMGHSTGLIREQYPVW